MGDGRTNGSRSTARRPPSLLVLMALSVTWLGCGGGENGPAADGAQASDPAEARTLHVDLQEGFDGGPVAIAIDGEVVFRAEAVTTSLLTGLADSTSIEVTANPVRLELDVGAESPRPTTIDLTGGAFIGLSVDDGELVVIQRTTAFGYG